MYRKLSLTIGVVCVAVVVSMAIAQQSARKPGPNRNGPQASKSLFGPDALKKPNQSFVLTSSAVKSDGKLPQEYTGDGGGSTLPLSWKGAPDGTKSYALIMDHLAPDDTMKSYWTMWDIPSTVTSLPKDTKGVGKVGGGFRGRLGYEPPNSKGPGQKIYVLTVYALSSPLQITQAAINVNRDVLLAAMKDKVLASSSLSVSYTRTGETQNNGERGGGQRGGGQRGQGDRQRPGDGGQKQAGGGHPLFPILDSNRDEVLDSDEIKKAAAAILRLDKNNDEQITSDEIPGGGGRGPDGRGRP